jgi:predicted ATPase
MKLRYLRIGNYPPLKDIQVAFAGQSPIDRQCAIRFMVGVNGSGKSHLLQAISEAFLALADWRVPHFPITMVYELGEKPAFRADFHRLDFPEAVLDGKHHMTVIIAASRSSSQQRPSLWVSESHSFEPDANSEEFEHLIDSLYKDKKQNNYRAVITPGQWTGEGTPQLAYLPDTVLAYTTGAQEPWQNIWARNGNAGGFDTLVEDEDHGTDNERPAGWTYERELKAFPTDTILQKDVPADSTAIGWKPILITPQLLKFALLAVVLPSAMNELKQTASSVKKEKGLSELLARADWDVPVSIAFALEFRPRDPEWSEAKLRQLLPWLEAAGEITGEPEPSRRRFLHFDLLGRLNRISDEETRKNLEGIDYQGDALLQILNNYGEANAYERFERLYAMHQAGLFDHLQICLRKKDTEDLILYDELSDGEQMILGRMALFHLLKERSDALLLMDEPETHFNDVWKREIVDIVDDALGETASEVMISTHSAIVLTDAMSRDIVLLERNAQGHAEVRQIRGDLQTFGATSDHPLRDVFGSPDTVGKRATVILETLLAATQRSKQVARYWQGDVNKKSDLAETLFDMIKHSQPTRCEWKFDADDVATALDQIKQFAQYYGVQAPFDFGSIISAFIDHMGPGYFKIELMRAWRKLKDNPQRDS